MAEKRSERGRYGTLETGPSEDLTEGKKSGIILLAAGCKPVAKRSRGVVA